MQSYTQRAAAAFDANRKSVEETGRVALQLGRALNMIRPDLTSKETQQDLADALDLLIEDATRVRDACRKS
jgi:hypothetical protein